MNKKRLIYKSTTKRHATRRDGLSINNIINNICFLSADLFTLHRDKFKKIPTGKWPICNHIIMATSVLNNICSENWEVKIFKYRPFSLFQLITIRLIKTTVSSVKGLKLRLTRLLVNHYRPRNIILLVLLNIGTIK